MIFDEDDDIKMIFNENDFYWRCYLMKMIYNEQDIYLMRIIFKEGEIFTPICV